MVNVYEERKSLELLLERTSQLYRQAHMERRQLVNTWKDAVNQMNQREKEIKETETEIESAKRISAEKVGVLAGEEIEMKIKKDQNKDTELHISELNIASSELRSRLLRLEDAVGRKSSEVGFLCVGMGWGWRLEENVMFSLVDKLFIIVHISLIPTAPCFKKNCAK